MIKTKKNKILSAEKVSQIIKENNQIFKKASKAKKRMMIAQDVIDNIKISNFIPTEGTWFESDKLKELYYSTLEGDASIQELIISKEIGQCKVCALGGLFLSTTKYNNKQNISDLDDGAEIYLQDAITKNEIGLKTSLKNEMDKIFSPEQLRMIEVAFEVGGGACSLDENDDLYFKCMDFGGKFDNSKNRLLAIMKNIVNNNGEFKP